MNLTLTRVGGGAKKLKVDKPLCVSVQCIMYDNVAQQWSPVHIVEIKALQSPRVVNHAALLAHYLVKKSVTESVVSLSTYLAWSRPPCTLTCGQSNQCSIWQLATLLIGFLSICKAGGNIVSKPTCLSGTLIKEIPSQ